MKLINKSRGTGKTTQLIYASAITGFRIITPNYHMAYTIKEMAKDMGLKIPEPIAYAEYRSRKRFFGDRTPVLIDELPNEILDEALELYFGSTVIAATMTVPIDDDCTPPTPKPLVFDHETGKVRMKTNKDVLHEVFGDLTFTMDHRFCHIEDSLTVNNLKIADWLDRKYVEPKEKENDI